mmetsp:Transcript_75730/g.157842  ORF Transcript_75730/g.157842 Transcript_75730/m.157842 type:complete len:209 (-) Transcript_75730:1092-1718(-)
MPRPGPLGRRPQSHEGRDRSGHDCNGVHRNSALSVVGVAQPQNLRDAASGLEYDQRIFLHGRCHPGHANEGFHSYAVFDVESSRNLGGTLPSIRVGGCSGPLYLLPRLRATVVDCPLPIGGVGFCSTTPNLAECPAATQQDIPETQRGASCCWNSWPCRWMFRESCARRSRGTISESSRARHHIRRYLGQPPTSRTLLEKRPCQVGIV